MLRGSQNRRDYYQGKSDSLELKISSILTEMGGMKSDFKTDEIVQTK